MKGSVEVDASKATYWIPKKPNKHKITIPCKGCQSPTRNLTQEKVKRPTPQGLQTQPHKRKHLKPNQSKQTHEPQQIQSD